MCPPTTVVLKRRADLASVLWMKIKDYICSVTQLLESIFEETLAKELWYTRATKVDTLFAVCLGKKDGCHRKGIVRTICKVDCLRFIQIKY